MLFPLLTLLACQAQQDTQPGPSFGGDLSFVDAARSLDAGQLPDPAELTEAGLLSALPVAIGSLPCPERACVSARSAWMDDELLVGIGFDGTPLRPPVELAFALDASCSVAGSEDVRAATVEVALEQLRDTDLVAIWGFTDAVAVLIPAAPPDPAHARRALEGLDRVDALSQLLTEHPSDTLEALLAALDREDDARFEDTGDTGDLLDGDDGAAVELVLELIALTEDDPVLEDGLMTLARHGGSAVDEAADIVLGSLPDGTEEQASRLVFVSDFDGPSALDAVAAAAERHVGTSVLGITALADRASMNELAALPGAHTFDAVEPSAALATWEQRFPALVAPNAWGVHVELAPSSLQEWEIVRRFGTTDGSGANAWFASSGHGTLALLLKPKRTDPAQPRFEIRFDTASGSETVGTWAKLPNRLLAYEWGEGDDEVALELAWRVALYDAVAESDREALDLWSQRP